MVDSAVTISVWASRSWTLVHVDAGYRLAARTAENQHDRPTLILSRTGNEACHPGNVGTALHRQHVRMSVPHSDETDGSP